jgi:hypothetical protein
MLKKHSAKLAEEGCAECGESGPRDGGRAGIGRRTLVDVQVVRNHLQFPLWQKENKPPLIPAPPSKADVKEGRRRKASLLLP